jgi:hypothetical protein
MQIGTSVIEERWMAGWSNFVFVLRMPLSPASFIDVIDKKEEVTTTSPFSITGV